MHKTLKYLKEHRDNIIECHIHPHTGEIDSYGQAWVNEVEECIKEIENAKVA